MRLARVVAWAAAVLLSGVLLVGVFAWPGAQGASPHAGEVHVFELGKFQSPSGAAAIGADGVRAETPDAQGMTLLRQATPGLHADGWRYLRYALDAPGAGAQQRWVWRGEAGQGNVVLPGASGTLDLSRHAAWHGAIEWVGVANAPVDYLAGVALDDTALQIRALELRPAGLGASLASLRSDWFGARPWTGRSINTGGFELAPVAGASFTAFIALWAALAWGLARLLFAAEGGRHVGAAVLVGAAALLAGWQIAQLAVRGSDAAAAARQARAHGDVPLAAQPQLALAAQRLAPRMAQDGARPRVLVHGANQFLGEYVTWLLREHDAAMLWEAGMLPAAGAPGDWRVVLVGTPDAAFDSARGVLRVGTQERRAELDVDAGLLKSYRLLPESSP